MQRKTISSVEESLNKYLPEDELREVKRILYGRSNENDNKLYLGPTIKDISKENNFELHGYSFIAKREEMRFMRIVRVAAIQHSIVKPTTDTIPAQRNAIHMKIGEIIKAAALSKVNIVCLQEAWNMPFAFCTQEKHPWCEFAEDAENGPTTVFLKNLAQTHNMVIISPILERDPIHNGVLWNTAVVISETGKILGKQRKNHIPPNGESIYYTHGNMGHPVFDTKFGKIAVNICYDRHHPQNWMMYGLNGAEIVFNPSTTAVNESWWGIEARNAAIANSYFTVAINRVGSETFSIRSENNVNKKFGPCYGSSYVAAPDGCRTPGLSRDRDGLLIVSMDLNLCQQMKDKHGFPMTQRLADYGRDIIRATQLDFKPQII